jgi:hypothetical protein
MDELILPPDCKYNLEKRVWICGGTELVVDPAEEENEYYEEEYVDCGSDLIPAELCTEDYEELEDYEEYEDY